MRIGIRVDSSNQIGYGHVIRCLALASELRRRGHQCIFICLEFEGNSIGLLKSYGYKVLSSRPSSNISVISFNGSINYDDSKNTLDILAKESYDWLVIDHYFIDNKWEKLASKYCKKILVIDDFFDREHYCDLFLNPNKALDAKEIQKHKFPTKCRFLVGPKFALLREDFSNLRRAANMKFRPISRITNILVMTGGVDQFNIANSVLIGLNKCTIPNRLNITVLLGSCSPGIEAVKRFSKADHINDISVLSDVSDVHKLMQNADIVVSTAGSTAWEICCLGLASILIPVTDNQKRISSYLNEIGAAIELHPHAISIQFGDVFNSVLSLERVRTMQSAAASIVDGLGAVRVADKILE